MDKQLKPAFAFIGIGIVIGAVIAIVLSWVFGAKLTGVDIGPIKFEIPTPTTVPQPTPTFTPSPSSSPEAGISQPGETLILASSRFDQNAEGWAIEGGGTGPSFIPNGGNPDGYVSGQDMAGENPAWFWKAPQEFLGDKSDAYGGILFFALTQDKTTGQITPTDDVVLVGKSIKLTLDINNPEREWTPYAVWMHELGGWKSENGNAATQGEIRRVLSSLNELRIRGEYRGGSDTGGLDNVILLRHP